MQLKVINVMKTFVESHFGGEESPYYWWSTEYVLKPGKMDGGPAKPYWSLVSAVTWSNWQLGPSLEWEHASVSWSGSNLWLSVAVGPLHAMLSREAPCTGLSLVSDVDDSEDLEDSVEWVSP